MAGTRAPFASLAALAAVASAQGEQPGTAAAESAKKDLQSLPTVQRPLEATPNKSLFSGTSSVTGLSLGTPSAPIADAKKRDNPAAGKPANWLLDGMNQLEAEAKSQRDASEAKIKNDNLQTSATGERMTAATTNPFTEYLTQWLSPRDQALLSAANRSSTSSSTAPWEIPRSDFRREATATPASVTTNPLQMELPGIANLPANRTAQNPYLAEPFQAEFAGAAPLVGTAGERETSGALSSLSTPAPSVLPPVAPAPIEQAKPAAVAPPTERLIDDRKYFPQLRRF